MEPHAAEEPLDPDQVDAALLTAIRKHRGVFLEIAVIACALGGMGAFAAVVAVAGYFQLCYVSEHVFALALYVLTCVVAFHMSEFLVAAAYRPHDTHPRAFMIYHSKEYMLATVAAMVEFLVEGWLVPTRFKLFTLSYGWSMAVALLVCFFYGTRVLAMIQCGENFSLQVETTHRNDHRLVTHGVFAYLRHPSYFGWFWRTVCSQLLLMNPVCLVAFTYVTWRFFKDRIEAEEQILSSDDFFGAQYKAYREKTGTGIPGIQ